MSISSNYKELFRNATIQDKLTLFQNLLDTKEDMTADLALALLKIIHKELSTRQIRDRSGYKRYAEAIESLRYQMADVLRQVVVTWQSRQSTIPADWFSDHKNE